MSLLIIQSSTLIFKCLGMLFLILAGIMLYFMTDSFTLKCKERKSVCVLTHYQWFRSQEKAIDHIKRAKITHVRSKQGSKSYFLKLKTSEGNIKLNQIGTPGKTLLRKNALSINRYIRNPRDNVIIIKKLYPSWFVILPAVFIISSLLIIFMPKKTLIRLDKSSNALIIQRKNIFSKKENKYALSQVKKIILEEATGKNSRLYRIAFVFKDDSIVPLTESYDNFLPRKIKCIDAICAFLNLKKVPRITEKFKNQKKLGLIIFIIALTFIAESAYLIYSDTFF